LAVKILSTSIFVIFFAYLSLNPAMLYCRDKYPSYDLDDSMMTQTEIPSIKREPLTWHKWITNIPYNWQSFGQHHLVKENMPALFGVISLTGALSLIDQKAYNETRSVATKNPLIKENLKNLVFIGDGRASLIASGILGIYSLITSDKSSLNTASDIIEANLATGILAQFMKRSFGREAPSAATLKGGSWQLFPSPKKYHKFEPKYYAYPSGHMATLTSTVTVVANNYPNETWIKPVGYSLIGIVGVCLVAKGMHWYSDLPMGIYLGYTMGNIITPPQNRIVDAATNSTLDNITFTPYISKEVLGFNFSFLF